ncbi:MAG: DHH family phosphoesterase [Candidatus Thorarchaeota archaeon]|nr:DHH family phosphoesterase [Candidatus Thorarchaeota archaeon]
MVNVVLTHGDLDGITSGAIALLAFPRADLYFTKPSQIHQDLYRVAKDQSDVVHISDIAINSKRFDDILRALDKFSDSTRIHWTDHHPLTARQKKKLSDRVDLFHEVGPCAAELVFRKFAEELPEHALRLALYGAIGDYCDDTPFCKKHFDDYDKRTLYLEAGILVQALQEIDYRRESKDLVRQLTMGIEPSSMNDIVDLALKATRIEHEVFRYVQKNARKMNLIGYVLDMPVNGYRGKSAKFAAYLTNSMIGISARSSGDDMDCSIRRRQCNIDLNKAMNAILPSIDGGQGGGHPAAAGASMSKNDFPRFLQSLAEYLDQGA